jgi:hypothetical protein
LLTLLLKLREWFLFTYMPTVVDDSGQELRPIISSRSLAFDLWFRALFSTSLTFPMYKVGATIGVVELLKCLQNISDEQANGLMEEFVLKCQRRDIPLPREIFLGLSSVCFFLHCKVIGGLINYSAVINQQTDNINLNNGRDIIGDLEVGLRNKKDGANLTILMLMLMVGLYGAIEAPIRVLEELRAGQSNQTEATEALESEIIFNVGSDWGVITAIIIGLVTASSSFLCTNAGSNPLFEHLRAILRGVQDAASDIELGSGSEEASISM